ncbi:MAG: hypothetical protein Q4E54_00880 [Lachnospiraceae bacterium]|nr:hypothetical protein [Lachnospiraceae bacterium]
MKKRKLVSILGVIALFALAAAPAVAYYSAKSPTVYNHFSISKGAEEEDKATVVESNWTDGAYDLQPGQIVPKNPVVTSNVDYTSKAYLGVAIPQVEGIVEGEDSVSLSDAVYLKDIGENWELIETVPGDKNTPELQVYSYGVVLEKNESTTPTFSNIEIPNFISFSDNKKKSIDVKGYLVQSECISDEEADAGAVAFFEKELLEDE